MTICVSYRRTDSADIFGRIYRDLTWKSAKDAVFKDVDHAPSKRFAGVFLERPPVKPHSLTESFFGQTRNQLELGEIKT